MSDSVFATLHQINVNDKTKTKNKLTYLSWAYAWAEVKKVYPDANYTVDQYDGKPYLYDENLGYLVSTVVTIEGQSMPMSLPVMDGANNAMKSSRYSYKVIEWVNRQKTGNMIDKWVEPATMFDINKTMMRCLVKNLAMFGLGLYIYAGEDLPEEPQQSEEERALSISKLKEHIESCGFTVEQVCESYQVKSITEFTDINAVTNQVTEWVKG